MTPIDSLAIIYRPSTDKPCTACVFLDGWFCTMWEAETRPGMGCAMWLKKQEKSKKGVDGE